MLSTCNVSATKLMRFVGRHEFQASGSDLRTFSLTSTSRPLCYKQGSSCKHAGYWKYIASVKFIWTRPPKTTKQPKTNKSSNQTLLNKSLPTNSSWHLTRPQIELGHHPCPVLLHLCREAWASLGQVVKFVRMMVKTSGIPLKRSINLASWVMYT